MAEKISYLRKDENEANLGIPERDPRPDMLLTRREVEIEFGLTQRFLEIAAWRGTGPPMVKIGSRAVRYRRGDVRSWIAERRIVPDGTAR